MKLQTLVSLGALVVAIEAAQTVRTYTPRPTEAALLRNRKADCVPNACLDALQPLAQCGCTRLGAVDCAYYFRTTITPEASTVYEVVTHEVTQTETDSAVETAIVTGTAIETIVETSTTTAATVTATGPVHIPYRRKRELVNSIPSYAAAACDSEEAYAIACSCAGMQPMVTTLPTPIVTVLIGATQRTVRETRSTTVVSTRTSTTTKTTTSLSLATETSTALVRGPFYLFATSSDSTSQANNQYAATSYDADGESVLTFSNPTMDNAAQFFLRPDGTLRPVSAPFDDERLMFRDSQGLSYLYINRLSWAEDSGYLALQCEIQTGIYDRLFCGLNSRAGLDTLLACGQTLAIGIPGYASSCATLAVFAET